MVVSRWFVMPMAAMSSADAPTSFMADSATPSWVVQISLASCSTQPGLGKYWVNSFCATLHISPLALKRMQRLDVVPASSAMIYFCFVIAVSPFYSRKSIRVFIIQDVQILCAWQNRQIFHPIFGRAGVGRGAHGIPDGAEMPRISYEKD